MKQFKIPYSLSKDYEKLFQLICDDNEVAAFVDYEFKTDKTIICRDVCTVRRYELFHINMGVRGITYASLDTYPWNGEYKEKDLFIAICKSVNLEWIEL